MARAAHPSRMLAVVRAAPDHVLEATAPLTTISAVRTPRSWSRPPRGGAAATTTPGPPRRQRRRSPYQRSWRPWSLRAPESDSGRARSEGRSGAVLPPASEENHDLSIVEEERRRSLEITRGGWVWRERVRRDAMWTTSEHDLNRRESQEKGPKASLEASFNAAQRLK